MRWNKKQLRPARGGAVTQAPGGNIGTKSPVETRRGVRVLARPYQLFLPFEPPWRRWEAWIAGELCWLANTGGGRPVGRRRMSWWFIKDRALGRWGVREGWDLQIFKCWGERVWAICQDGRERWVDVCGDSCERCDGTGIHRAIKLERWRIGRRLLHRPGRQLSRREANRALSEPERCFEGYIRHRRRRGSDAAAAILAIRLGLGWPRPSLRSMVATARRRVAAACLDLVDFIRAMRDEAAGYRIVGSSFRLPNRFRCPECGMGPLIAEVSEYSDTGQVTEAGFHLHCPDGGGGHRWWQSDWQPVIDDALAWCSIRVRRRDHLAEPDADLPIPF